MANNVEERIVAAKFDSEDFEKGVDKTIKKLDELKKSFNLEATGESVAELGNKASKSMESASNSLDKLSKSFTSFTGMIKQKLLSGLADEVVGVFFKIKNAVTGLFSSMTTGQISNGLAKYESALTSVRMIVNSYRHLIDGTKVNYTESEAYKSIEALQAYADETSYSMDQMTDSMSKMVAAGVSLEDAEKNVQGIANACAAAGINAQDAARAFFNLSQAYSSGYLKYTDYRSLELLNMTNENFQDALIAAAVEAGTLKAVKGKNGKATTYKTQKSAGNGKVTAGKTVTKQNLSEALKYNFVDTDVMDILFGSQYYLDVEDWNNVKDNIKGTENRIKALTEIVSTEKMAAKELENVVKALDKVDARKKQYLSLKDAKQRKAYLKSLQEDSELMEKAELLGIEKIVKSLDKSNQIRKDYESITDDTKRKEYLKSLEKNAEIIAKMPKKYSELAAKSFLAAREARNFRDVIVAIGDYVSSKLSKVFEHMFGTLETASNFFTSLTENGIGLLITDIADRIADASDAWDNLSNRSGGAMFRESILMLNDAIGDFIRLFTLNLLPEAEDMGWQMQLLTADFREAAGSVVQWVASLREWFEQKPNEEGAISRLQRLQNILSNISGVFTIAGRAMGLAVGTIAKTLSALSPVFDGLLIGLELITQPISDLSNDEKTFTDLANAIENILIPVRELATALAPVFKAIGQIGGAIAKFFIEGSISTVIMNIQLIGDAFKLFIELFGTQNMKDAEKGEKIIDRIQNDIKSLGNACKEAISFVKNFFDSLFKDLRTLFGLNEEADKQGTSGDQNGGVFAGIRNFLDTNEFLKKAEKWLAKAKDDIKKWFTELPGKINEFLTGLLYEKTTRTVFDQSGRNIATEEIYSSVGTPLKTFLDTTIDTVQKFIIELPGKLLAGVGKAVDLFGLIIRTVFGGMGDKQASDKKNGEASVTDAIHQWAENFNKKLQKEIMMMPSRLSHFIRRTRIQFNRTWKQIKTWFTTSETVKTIKDWGTTIFKAIKDFIVTLPERIKSLIKSAGAIGRNIISAIKTLFSSDDIKKETQKELEAGFTGIDLGSVLKTIADIGTEIVNQFLSWFTGSDDIDSNFTWLGETVSNLIKSIPNAIGTAVTFVTGQLGKLWNKIYTSIIGTNENGESIDSQVKKTIDSLTDENGNLHIAIENIPTLLGSAFMDASKAIGKLWDGLIDALTGKNKKPVTPGMLKVLDSFSGDYEKQQQIRESWAKQGYNIDGISDGFTKFIEEVGRLISQVFSNIPQYITNGLNTAFELTNAALTWLTEHLTSNLEESTEEVSDSVEKPEKGSLQESFVKLGTTLSNLIFTTIPEAIKAGFEAAAKTASTWLGSFKTAFEGLASDADLIASVQSIGSNIVSWIEKIPEQIRLAFATIKDKINGTTHDLPKNVEEQIKSGNVPDSIKEGLDNASSETAKETENSTLWATIAGIATDIGNALKTAFESLWPDISGIFADIPTYIANGLKFAATKINDAIASLGNWLKEDAAKNGTSTKEAADAVIESVTGGATEGAEKASEDSPFISAIKGLGAVIYKTIVETIPLAISSAFEWVGANWSVWKDSLKEIFKNVTGLTDADLSFDNLVKRITEAIKSLPEKIREAFNSIKGNLSSIFTQKGSNSVFKGLDATDPARNIEDELFPKPKELAAAYKKNQEAAAKELETANEGGGFWEAILGTYEELKTYLDGALNWVVENVGPLLIKGWNASLDTVTKLLGTLGDWLAGGGKEGDGSLGKAIGDNFGDVGSDLKSALESIGETIKNLFIHTIPRFIGNAIGSIVKMLPDMWSELWGGISETATKSADKEKKGTDSELAGAAEAVADTEGILTQILDSLKTQFTTGAITSGAAIIAGLLAVMEIFKLIKEVINTFNVSGNLAERTEAKNSIEAVFKRMLTAIIAAMAFTAYVANLEPEKFEQAKTIITMLTDTIKTVAGLYTAGSVGGGLLDLINGGNKDDSKDKTALKQLSNKEKMLNSATGIMEGITGGIKKVIGAGAASLGISWVGGSVSDLISQFTGTFSEVGEAVKLFAENIGTTFDDVSSLLEKITNAETVMTRTNDVMTKVVELSTYKGSVTTANEVIGSLTGPLGLFAKQFEGDLHPDEVIQALKDLMGMTTEMTEFANYVSDEANGFDKFKQAIASLGAALSFYNGSGTATPEMTTEGIHNAVEMLKAITGDSELMGLASTLATETFTADSKNIYTGAEQMLVLSGALASFGNAISGFNSDSVEAFRTFYDDIVSKITMDDVTGTTEGATTFAQKMHTLGDGLSSFASSAADLNSESVTIAGYALDMLATIAERAKKFKNGWLVTPITGSGDLGDFALNMGLVGKELRNFLQNITLDDDENTIEIKFNTIKAAMFALQQLSTAASRLKATNKNGLQDLLGDGLTLGQTIMKFMSSLTQMWTPAEDGTGSWSKIDAEAFNFDGIKEIISSFSSLCTSLGSITMGTSNVWQVFGALSDGQVGIVSLASKIMAAMRVFGSQTELQGVDMNVVHDVVGTINSLFDAVSAMHIFDVINGMHVYDGAGAMEVVIDALSTLNGDMSILTTFLDNAQGLVGKYNISEIASIVDVIRVLGEGLNWFATNNLSDVSFATDGLLNLQTLEPSMLTEAVTKIMGSLEEVLKNEQNIETLKASGKTMAEYLFEGMELAFNDPAQPLQPHITPILELDTAKSQLSQFFGLGENTDFNITSALTAAAQSAFGSTNVQDDIYAYMTDMLTPKLDAIDSKLGTFSDDIKGVASSIDGMGVLIDGDRLVGEIGDRIDRYLGWVGINHSRQQTTWAGDYVKG